MIVPVLALTFAVLFGYSLSHFPTEILPLGPKIWMAITFFSGIGTLFSFYFSFYKKKRASAPNQDWKWAFSRLQREFMQALRGHLKISILFWSYYYKKEKVKTLEEAKKEVFQDLKKEFSQVHWMLLLLEEIRQELTKYK